MASASRSGESSAAWTSWSPRQPGHEPSEVPAEPGERGGVGHRRRAERPEERLDERAVGHRVGARHRAPGEHRAAARGGGFGGGGGQARLPRPRPGDQPDHAAAARGHRVDPLAQRGHLGGAPDELRAEQRRSGRAARPLRRLRPLHPSPEIVGLEPQQHPGVAQRVRLDVREVEELRDARVVAAQHRREHVRLAPACRRSRRTRADRRSASRTSARTAAPGPAPGRSRSTPRRWRGPPRGPQRRGCTATVRISPRSAHSTCSAPQPTTSTRRARRRGTPAPTRRG